MEKNNLPKSIKRFIRKEKARIRHEFFDLAQQQQQIAEVYKKFIKTPGTAKPEKKAEEKPAKKAEKKTEKKAEKKDKPKTGKESKPKEKSKK
jgi:hypothetical protein